MKLVAQGGSGDAAASGDYGEYDRPTVLRRQRQDVGTSRLDPNDPHYLDIPAFLRRQAD
jgi:hypothetical protein